VISAAAKQSATGSAPCAAPVFLCRADFSRWFSAWVLGVRFYDLDPENQSGIGIRAAKTNVSLPA
jgi:hypothetical protein